MIQLNYYLVVTNRMYYIWHTRLLQVGYVLIY